MGRGRVLPAGSADHGLVATGMRAPSTLQPRRLDDHGGKEQPLVENPSPPMEGAAEEEAAVPTLTNEVTVEVPAPLEPMEEVVEAATSEESHSVFRRQGRRPSPQRQMRLPDRFPDLRRCPSQEALFGSLRPVSRDGRDPPHSACFNCRQGGHTGLNCREPPQPVRL